MNKKILLALPLFAIGLAACEPTAETTSSEDVSGETSSDSSGESTSSSSSSTSDIEGILIPEYPYVSGGELAEKAVASLSGRNHAARIHFRSDIFRYANDELGVMSDRLYEIAYDYDDGELAYSEYSELTYGDYVGEDYREDTEYTVTTPTAYYFRDPDDGTISRESLTLDNTVSVVTMADYDEMTGTYTPYAFEEMYKNPWDYIRSSDLSLDSEGKLHLSLEKANFLVDCYYGTATNWVKDCIVNFTGDEVTSLSFDFDDEIGARYWRISTAEVSYTRHGEDILHHLTPYTNNNPELASALLATEEMTNFTYKKEFISDDSEDDYGLETYVTAYYTPETVFYNQNDEVLDMYFENYVGGSDVNYRVDYNEDEGIYYVLEFGYANDQWHWGYVSLSSNALYTIDSFSGIGPRLYDINPALFRKTGDYTYVSESLAPTSLGAYIDNQMQGCSTAYLETSTIETTITLDPTTGNIATIDTGFTTMGKVQKIRFTLSDIGTTVVPEYAYDGYTKGLEGDSASE